jgi:hypothetical protein
MMFASRYIGQFGPVDGHEKYEHIKIGIHLVDVDVDARRLNASNEKQEGALPRIRLLKTSGDCAQPPSCARTRPSSLTAPPAQASHMATLAFLRTQMNR